MKRLTATLVVGLLLVAATVLYADTTITGNAVAGRLDDGTPYVRDYPATSTTGYFTPSCQDYTDENGDMQWCSSEKPTCFTSEAEIRAHYGENVDRCLDRGGSFCCIPQSHRGFYEDVRCQGSGSCRDQVYYHSKITPTPYQNPWPPRFQNGITATQTDPVPKDTIAVNPNPNSDCYIPYDSKVYVDFGPDNEWTGIYTAEDTGKAFQGDGTTSTGECKIDIYTGPGAQQETAEVTASGVDVYIVEEGDGEVRSNIQTPTSEDTPSRTTGYTEARYSTKTTVHNYGLLFQESKNFAEALKNRCSQLPYQERSNCVEQVANTFRTSQYDVRIGCSQTQETTILQEPPENRVPVATGEVTEASSLRSIDNDYVERTITLRNQTNTTVTIQSQDPGNLYAPKGTRITVYDLNAPTQIGNTITTPVNLDEYGVIQRQTTYTERSKITDYTLQLADCAESKTPCICDLQTPRTDTVKHRPKLISYDDFERQEYTQHNLILRNASDIPLGLNRLLQNPTQLLTAFLPDGTEQFIDVPTFITTENSKQHFTIDTDQERQYFYIDQNNVVNHLAGKPVWYNDSYNASETNQLFQDVITTAIQSQLPPPIQANPEELLVNQCEPTVYHETFCASVTPPAGPQPRTEFEELPPLRFTVKI